MPILTICQENILTHAHDAVLYAHADGPPTSSPHASIINILAKSIDYRAFLTGQQLTNASPMVPYQAHGTAGIGVEAVSRDGFMQLDMPPDDY